MRDLDKIYSTRLLDFWKSQCLGLLVLICAMFLSQILPYYFAPIVSLLGAAVLYTFLYNNKLNSNPSCMVINYALFYCMIVYSTLTIISNILYIWGYVELPKELTFFKPPFIASLIFNPVCFLVFGIIILRGGSLNLCFDCKFKNGLSIDRGQFGQIIHHESSILKYNLFVIFTLLTAIVWTYYYTYYDKSADLNTKDLFVFVWLNPIILVLDMLYFAARYYNIYLDLKEQGEIITEDELGDMTTKTYLRFYVVCGNFIYLNTKALDPRMPFRNLIDTPFMTKRNVNGISAAEVDGIIEKMSGVKGQLKFFYGRKNPDMDKHRLVRYFYYLDGTIDDYPELGVAGEWIDFSRIKQIYNNNPNLMANILLADISRLATIVLTQKIFDEKGFRRIKTKSYQPTFNLLEVREHDYDFQDDKWIRVAMFNSDSRGFLVKRLWRRSSRVKRQESWRR